MNRLKTLFVQFESDLGKHQVPAFRGAIIEKVGRENLLFHNHKSDQELYYGYPLIQYKSLHRKPALFCLGQGVDEIHKLFMHKSWDVHVNGEKLALKIERLDMNTVQMQVWEKQFAYRITDWLALKKENYLAFKALQTPAEKTAFLERILTANLLAFAKGIGWTVERKIELRIERVDREKLIRYKGIPLQAFDLSFSCNLYLPNFIGLGKSASHGFGTVRHIKKDNHHEPA